jgi:hypothetical protein
MENIDTLEKLCKKIEKFSWSLLPCFKQAFTSKAMKQGIGITNLVVLYVTDLCDRDLLEGEAYYYAEVMTDYYTVRKKDFDSISKCFQNECILVKLDNSNNISWTLFPYAL